MKQKSLFLLFLLLGLSVAATGQNHRISGIVISAEDGAPIPGATLMVEGTTIGVATLINGRFEMNVPHNSTVVVQFLGMVPYSFKVTEARSDWKIVLKNDSRQIDEVIVIAYGTSTRASFTGSASVVDSKKLETRSISNLSAALEGNAPGVQLTSALGQPGASASVRIRGFGSYGASNSPLYVVDGAVYNADLSSINPNDIASMTILKDAQSTSLYGSSAGNGVILITTKKGASQKGSISFNMSQGLSEVAYKDYTRVGIWDYMPLQWEMLKNSKITSGKTAEVAAQEASNEIVGLLKYNPFAGVDDKNVMGTDGKLTSAASRLKWGDDLDWEKAAYKKGHRQEYNLGYNSRTDNSDMYASMGYLNETGYMINTKFERYTGRVNYNLRPVEWIKAGLNLAMTRSLSNQSMSISDNTSSYGNLNRFLRQMAPIYPIHKHDMETGAYLNANGQPTTDPSQYVYDYDGSRLSVTGRHAIAEQLWNVRSYAINTTMGKAHVAIMPVEGLEITANYSIDLRENHMTIYRNRFVGDGAPGGDMYKYAYRTTSESFQQIINYNKSWDRHNFQLTAGHESQSWIYSALYGSKKGETVGGVYEFENFTSINGLTSYTDTYTKEGYFARLSYDYDNKYYASASYRHDGSSRFAKELRWGDFWSVGASWRASQEDFMKEIQWIDNLKVRASYGETGVDNVSSSYYPYQSLYDLGANNGTESGMFFSTMANPELKWETQISSDVAVEFTLFGRLSGTVEYFQKNSKNLIFNVSMPTSSGVASRPQNIGKFSNKGWEIDLNYNIVAQRNWRVDVNANATFLKNRVVRLPEENREQGIVDGSKKLFEGKSRYQYWLRQWWGVDPDTGDGLYYLDASYDPATAPTAVKNSIVEKDGVYLTKSYSYANYAFSDKATPDVFGGFGFHIGYRNFDLTTTFSYQLGGKVLDTNYAGLMDMSNLGTALHPDLKNAWRNPGDISDVPRVDNNATHASNILQSNSTRWLVSSDYLNLRAISLSYNFPKALLDNVNMSAARLTLNAENLFMLKARQGLDPMANYTGLTYNEYIPARVLTLSLNVTF